MTTYRDHQPIIIEEFNGLFDRGDQESVPIDHFSDGENIQFTQSGFGTRFGIEPSQTIGAPNTNIKRIYNYITQTANTLLFLDGDGSIWHQTAPGTVLGPILTIVGMEDFGFEPWAGRAYITPFKTYGSGINAQQKGMQNEFVYVYLGDGTTARKAAGAGPGTGTFTIANDGSQLSDAGNHLFGVVFEYDTGYLSAPGKFTLFNSNGTGFDFSNIPVSLSSAVVARRLVMTRKIDSYNGNETGYTYYFIPDGRIANNTATTLSNITVFDADLLEDASHLIDNYSEIPACVGLSTYHQRLVYNTTYNDISLCLVSAIGEPEAVSQIDGFLIAPLDGNPLTVTQELRDILYGFKKNRTVAWIDNGLSPSEWPLTVIDQAIGCPVHGIGTVADSGGSNIDYLMIASFKGIVLFNGTYANPELSWKIQSFWLDQDKNLFYKIQILNDSVDQIIYCILPDARLLIGNYSMGLNPKTIRWIPWRFDIRVDTIAFIDDNTLIIGSSMRLFE